MKNLAHAIRQLHSGALTRPEFLAQLDRVLAAAPAGAGPLLEELSEENARAPLDAELYAEVQRRIDLLAKSRQRVGADDTFFQTTPGAETIGRAPPQGGHDEPFGAEPPRMKSVGDTLNGRFVLEECIGFGGMGTVYKALDLRKLEASDRKPYIAIKVLNVQFRGHPKSLIALQREARKAQSLAHPNIVSVYDFDRDRDGAMVYLTMEYLSGEPLSQVLRAPGFAGMPYSEAMRIVKGMGAALAYAHERGFVHCDFKPGNVFLTDAGKVKVIDFGIARVFQKAEEDVDVTVFDPGSLGALTPAYASPEMLEHRDSDPRDDIYALGCITYELLTGRHPFNRMSALDARNAGMRPRRPPKLGRRQWRALKCAMAFERGARTPTVARFLAQIGENRRGVQHVGLAATGAGMIAAAVLAVIAARYFWPGPAPGLAQQTVTPAPAAPRSASTPAPATRTAPEPATGSATGPATAAAAATGSSTSTGPASAAGSSTATAPAAGPATGSANVPTTAPAPAPARAPDVEAVAKTLAAVPCSALVASVEGHALTVHGYLPKGPDGTRVRDRLGALPGVAQVSLDVQPVDPEKCAVVSTFAPYWIAHRRAGGGARLRLAAPHAGPNAILTEGDPLAVDVTTGASESFVSVDYFALDGSVVHLMPNPRARDNRAPPAYTATIGSMGEWAIGKPFGTELLVLMTTPVPLFDGLRPVSESRADYLPAVARQLKRIGARNGADKIAVDFLQIATRPRTP
ncbi:MAG: protein kinase [Massilia sp.]